MSDINSLMSIETLNLTIDQKLLFTLDSMVRTIIESESYRMIEIEYILSKKYRGDFFGLLNELNVYVEFFYLNMVLNNLKSSESFNGDTNTIVVVNEEMLNRILSVL